MPKIKQSWLFEQTQFSSYAEQMYVTSATKKSFLQQDYDHLNKVIQSYQPDLIITLNRFVSPIIANTTKIPCWAFVHSEMYRHSAIDDLKEINEFLTTSHQKPITKLTDIFARCQRRIGFNPIEFSPFSSTDQISRIGILSTIPPTSTKEDTICISLGNTTISPRKIRNIIKDTFLGSPTKVNVWYHNCRTENVNNIHFLSSMTLKYLDTCKVCIHDGNLYLLNLCLARGIPQFVITNQDYLRMSTARSLNRSHCGTWIMEKQFDVAHLYEQYRAILCHKQYALHTSAFQDILQKDGDLTNLLNWLPGEKHV